jgi:membrane-associated protease RseP (regulator of RpoE activity)
LKIFFIDLFSFILFLFALLFSVMVHELGHFLTARHFHMKVTEFFIGFGKKLFSFKRGETEYGVKAIPAGGYCRIAGMTPVEEIDEADLDRAFYRSSIWKRITVLIAGSFGHFVVAIVLLFGLLVGLGEESIAPIVGKVPNCFAATCGNTPSTPASIAGLQNKDVIEQINGKYFSDVSQFTDAIQNNTGKKIDILILRNKKKVHVFLTPIAQLSNGKTVGKIGIQLQPYVILAFHRDNPITAAGKTVAEIATMTKESLLAIPSIPAKVPGIVRAIFGHTKRDINGPVGVVGIARVTAQTFAANDLSTQEKIGQFISLIVSLNVFVGIFNLIPLLPLDGGHVLIAVIDGVRRRKAAKKGVEAIPFDLEKMTPFIIVVFGILAALSLLLIVADIVNPVHI